MPPIEIRQFESGDGKAVRALHERAMRDAGDFVEGAPEPDLDDVAGHYLETEGEFLVATSAGDVVGMIAFHPVSEWLLAEQFSFGQRTAELTRLRVDPDHQRHGIGESLFEELECRARAAGYEQFVLDVSEDNDGARRFYEQQGFEYVETASFDAMDRTFRLAVYRRPISGNGQA